MRRAVREPSGQPELLGMEEAKAAIREAITLPLQMADLDRIFWRSAERGALLLSGPAGSGKRAAAEAAASEANAQVLHLGAREAQSNFCRTALAASSTKPVLVLIEDLESAPEAALRIRRCLGEVARAKSRVVCVATAGSDPSAFLQPRESAPQAEERSAEPRSGQILGEQKVGDRSQEAGLSGGNLSD
ncbi:unnamed protein product [Effrenium voratum]|uniref:ATPase AAA-type core domain-containing protein n=1 Tax=Effrenium voratum TaxID=2562239 RepID=A0AA36HV00_9DINO|nr:unnamed protein product [Effrenium voratum]